MANSKAPLGSLFLRLPLAIALTALPGCSVMLAATSPRQPDLSVVTIGSQRRDIESQLGRPIDFLRTSHGDIATYSYLGPDEISYRRATAYALADALTLGMFEIVGFPTEALQNDQHILKITYDLQRRVKKIEQAVKKAPLERPEKILGLDKMQKAAPQQVAAAYGPPQGGAPRPRFP